jgi:hypothetical protein
MSTTNNNGAAAPVHPLDLALLALIAMAHALLPLLVALLALVLAVAGWRPRADAQIRPLAEQMSQLPITTAVWSECALVVGSTTTVKALRAAARERGLPSRQWKSARKAELLALLA